jgi:hypothetical protein
MTQEERIEGLERCVVALARAMKQCVGWRPALAIEYELDALVVAHGHDLGPGPYVERRAAEPRRCGHDDR